jgi:hypothetical protein
MLPRIRQARGADNAGNVLAHNGVAHRPMTRITLEHTFVLSKDAVFRDLDGEAVILDLAAGTYFGLNAVGTRIWQLLERHGRLQEVHDVLRQEYDAPSDVLESDLLGLVARLVEARLGQVQPPE